MTRQANEAADGKASLEAERCGHLDWYRNTTERRPCERPATHAVVDRDGTVHTTACRRHAWRYRREMIGWNEPDSGVTVERWSESAEEARQ